MSVLMANLYSEPKDLIHGKYKPGSVNFDIEKRELTWKTLACVNLPQNRPFKYLINRKPMSQ